MPVVIVTAAAAKLLAIIIEQFMDCHQQGLGFLGVDTPSLSRFASHRATSFWRLTEEKLGQAAVRQVMIFEGENYLRDRLLLS